jgi:hypothetical protein
MSTRKRLLSDKQLVRAWDQLTSEDRAFIVARLLACHPDVLDATLADLRAYRAAAASRKADAPTEETDHV